MAAMVIFLALCWIASFLASVCVMASYYGAYTKPVTATLRSLGVTVPLYSVVILIIFAINGAFARDLDGRYAATNPELHDWFEGLRSGKGPCCSDADGSAVLDVDWESVGGHYRVRIDGEWVPVPDEAVITEPNRIGRAMVWPIKGYLGVSIRCFMPGSMG